MTQLDATALRELQAPLKQRYREHPEAASVPVGAEAAFEAGDEGVVSCTVQGWSGPVRAGLHPATGGDGDDACSADLLLEALVACAGVTLAAVATAMSIPIRSAEIVATGHWDARGTLGVDREAPVGMTDITLHVDLDSDADDATLDRLVALTERYCVIAQTLADPRDIGFVRGPAAA